MSEPETQTRRFVVACPTCDTRAELDDPNEAVEMHRRHASVTGHAMEWERADPDVDADAPPEDVEAAVRTFGEHYEDGVPVGVVAAAMSQHGVDIGETLDRLRELRLEGRLYEPRDDHLLHT